MALNARSGLRSGRAQHVEGTPARVPPPSPEERKKFKRGEVDMSGLPGENTYDDAVSKGKIDYQTAKVREEVTLVNERLAQARVATEAARIDLDKQKLALEKEREHLISRDVYLQRQGTLVSAFLELLRLTITDLSVKIPAGDREAATGATEERSRQALAALAESILKKQSAEVATQAMYDAFRGGE